MYETGDSAMKYSFYFRVSMVPERSDRDAVR